MNSEKVVLITGCSTGIGRSLAEKLTENGYRVAASARNLAALDGLPTEMKLALDVTRPETIQAAIKAVNQKFGRIDILVNNAGYATRGVVEELRMEDVQREFDVNVYGLIRMTQAVLPVMRRQGDGKIINIGSISGKFAQPVNGAYCASKFAVEALTDSLRMEVSGFNIQVALIEPGPIDTCFAHTSTVNSSDVTGNASSPYAAMYLADKAFRERQTWSDRDKAVNKLVKIIGSKTLKPRYFLAVPFASRMISHFPDSVKDRLLLKVYANKPAG